MLTQPSRDTSNSAAPTVFSLCRLTYIAKTAYTTAPVTSTRWTSNLSTRQSHMHHAFTNPRHMAPTHDTVVLLQLQRLDKSNQNSGLCVSAPLANTSLMSSRDTSTAPPPASIITRSDMLTLKSRHTFGNNLPRKQHPGCQLAVASSLWTSDLCGLPPMTTENPINTPIVLSTHTTDSVHTLSQLTAPRDESGVS